MAWFRRKDDDSMDPQVLLAQAQAAKPAPLDPSVASTAGYTAPPLAQLPEASATPAAPAESGSGFRLPIEDVFTITGRGTVVTGRVEAGALTKGSTVRLTRADGSTRDVQVSGIEMFRKVVDTAQAGDNVGLILRDLGRDDVGRGDVLSG